MTLVTISRLLQYLQPNMPLPPLALPAQTLPTAPQQNLFQDQYQSLFPGVPRLVPMQTLLPLYAPPQTGIQTEPGVSAATTKALESVPGTAWAGKFDSNGKRETAILMPQPFDTSKPTEVVFFFHGHNGTIANALTNPSTGFAGTIQDMARSRNIIMVIPQGPPKERDSTWMNPKFKESLAQFQQDTFAQIEKMAPGVQISQVTLKGHSAGGLPLVNGATAGGIRADRVDFLDASYGYWASESWGQLKKHGLHPQMNVIYIPGTGTEADAKRLKSVAGVSLQTSKVGHGQVPKTFLAQ